MYAHALHVHHARFMMGLSGWSPRQFPLEGESSSGIRGSMECLPAPDSPRHQIKRRRLSRLLDKLIVQINNNNTNNNNNNNYQPSSQWHMPDAPETLVNEDLPLDLSLKSEHNTPTSPLPNPVFTCETCGQTFSLQDRLAKHIASRHRNRTDTVRAYECEICLRRFARSDMLTRHARLHSGVKPYSCAVCGQVFSRSDHLATHQRTHTGEKPYRCPTCPYAACRRDMITRHMRTHMRRPQPA